MKHSTAPPARPPLHYCEDLGHSYLLHYKRHEPRMVDKRELTEQEREEILEYYLR